MGVLSSQVPVCFKHFKNRGVGSVLRCAGGFSKLVRAIRFYVGLAVLFCCMGEVFLRIAHIVSRMSCAAAPPPGDRSPGEGSRKPEKAEQPENHKNIDKTIVFIAFHVFLVFGNVKNEGGGAQPPPRTDQPLAPSPNPQPPAPLEKVPENQKKQKNQKTRKILRTLLFL